MGGRRGARGKKGPPFRRPHAGPTTISEGKPQLSLRDEARNTERHFLGSSNVCLRDNGIGFVSAGNMKSEDPALLNGLHKLHLQDDRPESEQQATEGPPVPGEDKTTPPDPSSEEPAMELDNSMENDTQQTRESDQEPTEPIFFIDVEGTRDVGKPELPNPKVRLASPPLDNSSDDEVVFPGRGGSRPVVLTDDHDPEVPAEASGGYKATAFEQELLPKFSPLQRTDPPTPEVSGLEGHQSTPSSAHSPAPVRLKDASRISRRASKRRRFTSISDEDDAVIADYIENMLENAPSDEEFPSAEGVTSVEYSSLETGHVTKESGKVWKNENSELEDVRISEQQKTTFGPNLAESYYIGLSEESSDEDSVRVNQMEDIGDLFIDEDIANFVADDMEDVVDTVTEPSGRKNKNRNRSRRAQFPSASAFADALDQDPYGAFDIMDFDRPSLKKKAKGRRNAPDFDLSDSEMELELHQSWESDRKKKKLKKQEREERRAQGLLGTKARKKGATTDVMTLEDIMIEMRTFLLSDSKSLSLPPMDKKNRKLVHELASTISLKSISKGSGASRFPILTKTFRTPDFDPASITKFDRVVSGNRFFRRLEKSQGPSKGSRAAPKARGGTKEASYMDGEVVGASAPEIGTGNKGRAMLEKMGWSMGTALGADNNKGILQPVTHVVKTNKAGLG